MLNAFFQLVEPELDDRLQYKIETVKNLKKKNVHNTSNTRTKQGYGEGIAERSTENNDET